MSMIEDSNSLDTRNQQTIFERRQLNGNFETPKISSSVSFNNLNPKNHRAGSKSPFNRISSETIPTSVTPHPLPGKKIEVPKNRESIDDDLQNTWKKAPKISKKLPPAFGAPLQKSSGSLPKNFIPNSFQPSLEPIQNIEQMVEIQEYKNATSLLSPLKKKPKSHSGNDGHKDETKSKNEKKARNPLLPLKNYLILTKLNEELKDKGDIGVDKLEKVYKLHKENQSGILKKDPLAYPIRLNEMITLNVMKSSHETGVIKKVLHAPSLRMMAIKEVPLTTKEARNNLKEWLNQWQNTFPNSKNHVKVHATAFNSPEGCLSIVMELMSGGSLQNLLESVGTLPEKVIRGIAQQSLTAIQEVHDNLKVSHGLISPSQILVSKDGTVKLSMGLHQRIHPIANNNFFNTIGKNAFDKISLYELTPINNPNSFQKQLAGAKDLASLMDNKTFQFSQDIFYFGYTMLVCAVGGLELFESSDFTEKLKIFIEENSKKPQDRSKYCCLIHNEDIISSIKLPSPESTLFTNKPVKVQKAGGMILDKNSKLIPQIKIQDLLSSNFSKEFIEFLCSCLRFDVAQRANIKDLLSSSFLKKKDSTGPSITLNELLKISSQWSKNFVLPPEYQCPSETHLNKLGEALATVLPNCDRFAESRDISDLEYFNVNSVEIQDLAADMGIPASMVWNKIGPIIKSLREQYT